MIRNPFALHVMTPGDSKCVPIAHSQLQKTTSQLAEWEGGLQAIQAFAEQHKLTIVPDFIGHGVGRSFHSSPMVHSTRNRERGAMKPWQTFTIEPIFSNGSARTKQWKDGWTVVTADGSWTAQHEHTIMITENGHEILTQL